MGEPFRSSRIRLLNLASATAWPRAAGGDWRAVLEGSAAGLLGYARHPGRS